MLERLGISGEAHVAAWGHWYFCGFFPGWTFLCDGSADWLSSLYATLKYPILSIPIKRSASWMDRIYPSYACFCAARYPAILSAQAFSVGKTNLSLYHCTSYHRLGPLFVYCIIAGNSRYAWSAVMDILDDRSFTSWYTRWCTY